MIVLRFEAATRNFDEFNHDSLEIPHDETGDRKTELYSNHNYSAYDWCGVQKKW
jgi:hypothetical protein